MGLFKKTNKPLSERQLKTNGQCQVVNKSGCTLYIVQESDRMHALRSESVERKSKSDGGAVVNSVGAKALIGGQGGGGNFVGNFGLAKQAASTQQHGAQERNKPSERPLGPGESTVYRIDPSARAKGYGYKFDIWAIVSGFMNGQRVPVGSGYDGLAGQTIVIEAKHITSAIECFQVEQAQVRTLNTARASAHRKKCYPPNLHTREHVFCLQCVISLG